MNNPKLKWWARNLSAYGLIFVFVLLAIWFAKNGYYLGAAGWLASVVVIGDAIRKREPVWRYELQVLTWRERWPR